MLLFLAALCLQVVDISCLDCYRCDNISNSADCHTVVVCPSDALCSTVTTDVGGHATYNMSCRPKQDCPNIHTTNPSPSAIGRRSVTCSQCCSKDSCNKALCTGGAQTPGGQCADDIRYDCAQMSTIYDICADISHAKTVCRHFCDLCDLVDGAWSAWTAWSACGVTCGTGGISRTRTCTNPAPANGGLNCSGTSTQSSSCHLQACPVHGGWTAWHTWGHCSSTCGIGLQTRARTCSNPRPDRFGDHCFGESRDTKACFLRACADGGWSSWGSWGACSATCSGGLQHRTRSCNHPQPSAFGKTCAGNNQESRLCHHELCPDQLTPVVTFNAMTASKTIYSSDERVRYINSKTNVGGAYSTTTGLFTAPYNGLYSFTVQLCNAGGHGVAVQVFAAGKVINTIYQLDNSNACRSLNTVTELKAGETASVWISYGNRIYQDATLWNTFSGALLYRTL